MGFLQVGDGRFRVVLERVEVLVAEQVLHVPEVRTAADQLGRATAAEGVRRDRDRQVESVGVDVQPFEERVVLQERRLRARFFAP